MLHWHLCSADGSPAANRIRETNGTIRPAGCARQSAATGDRTLFKRTVEALAAEERAKNHHVLAAELAKYVGGNGNGLLATAPLQQQSDLAIELTPRKSLSDIVLPAGAAKAVAELIEEQHRADLLRSFGLEPRSRVLLCGPPGNGKTSVAEAMAKELLLPFYVVRHDAIVGSYLGETASRSTKVFNHVRTRPCILFFDEFDTLGKERGDAHDTGEIKRVVSSLLLQIDDLPSHVVVVTATYHPELLDSRVWQWRLSLKPRVRCGLPTTQDAADQ